MSISKISCYVDGIVNMASYNLNPSYAIGDCFSKENFQGEFQKRYSIKEEIHYEELDVSLNAFTEETLHLKEKSKENFIYWLEKEVGKIHHIYEGNKELQQFLENTTPFYFVEEVYFLECENYVVSIIIGNNE